MTQNGTLSTDVPLRTETEWGLRIDFTLARINEKVPLTMTAEYFVDTLKFKSWLANHPDLSQGMLTFQSYGIGVAINEAKWDKAGYFIYADDDTRIVLPLKHAAVRFRVHRNVLNHEDFCVYIEDPQVAQTI